MWTYCSVTFLPDYIVALLSRGIFSELFLFFNCVFAAICWILFCEVSRFCDVYFLFFYRVVGFVAEPNEARFVVNLSWNYIYEGFVCVEITFLGCVFCKIILTIFGLLSEECKNEVGLFTNFLGSAFLLDMTFWLSVSSERFRIRSTWPWGVVEMVNLFGELVTYLKIVYSTCIWPTGIELYSFTVASEREWISFPSTTVFGVKFSLHYSSVEPCRCSICSFSSPLLDGGVLS